MTSPDPVKLGNYRGFDMELFYEPYTKEYCINLKGALSYKVTLGADVHGNITRLDNALDGMEPKLTVCKDQLVNIGLQMETAKAESQVPFAREAELAEKTAKLAELTVSLKLTEKDHEILDGAPDEGDSADAPVRKDKERDDER
jgi:hypothetical protein